MKKIDGTTKKILSGLRSAVTKDLERKRRLGQYAVIWKDNRVAYIGTPPPDEGSNRDD